MNSNPADHIISRSPAPQNIESLRMGGEETLRSFYTWIPGARNKLVRPTLEL